MVRSTVRCILWFGVLGCGVTFPQIPAAVHPEGGLAIRVTVNSVLLNVSVRDRNSNRSLAGLQPEDFEVYENGILQQVQDLRTVDVPFSLLLLMDVSGSTRSYMKLMKKAATEFADEVGEDDRVAVAQFNSRVRLTQEFTSDVNAARKAVERLHSGGGTAFYDALLTCVNEYVRNVVGRKAIVVFTDGVDNKLYGNPNDASRSSFQDLYARLQETDAIIYTIFLDSRGKHRPDDADDSFAAYQTAMAELKTIARLTGGRTYAPAEPEDLSHVYAEIADDLRIQYLLSYASSNPPQNGEWRSIHVDIHDHPEATVRTRTGYTAHPMAATTFKHP
jgi:Ca-activated chloride channel homolog